LSKKSKKRVRVKKNKDVKENEAPAEEEAPACPRRKKGDDGP
jgi:hypothetical protein